MPRRSFEAVVNQFSCHSFFHLSLRSITLIPGRFTINIHILGRIDGVTVYDLYSIIGTIYKDLLFELVHAYCIYICILILSNTRNDKRLYANMTSIYIPKF